MNGSCKFLFCLFNKFIEYEKIPDELKIAKVTPILKNNKNRNLFNSYRCVSVQPNIFRLFELIILNKIKPYFGANNIIPSSQYGYKESIGLHNIHIDIQNVIYKTLNEKYYIGIDIIFLDLSDAFDTVCHSKLLTKLELYGIRGKLLSILKDIFHNRKQIVSYQNVISNEINVISGCFQGGILSPTLFNVYTSDMINCVNSFMYSYADDTVLLRPIFDENDCNILQNDLTNICFYCENNFLKLNHDKSVFLRITNKTTDYFNYQINGVTLNRIETHKHIGVYYDSKMRFNDHVNYLVEKAMKRFYTIRYLSKRLNPNIILKLYMTYIIPILEYSNLCLVLTKTQMNLIENVQRKVSRFICFKSGKCDLDYEARLKFLDIDSLDKRRKIQLMKLIFKIRNRFKEIPIHWFNELEFYEHHRLGTFARLRFNRIVTTDKNLFDYSIKMFNELPKTIRNENNFCKYNNLINCHLNTL